MKRCDWIAEIHEDCRRLENVETGKKETPLGEKETPLCEKARKLAKKQILLAKFFLFVFTLPNSTVCFKFLATLAMSPTQHIASQQ